VNAQLADLPEGSPQRLRLEQNRARMESELFALEDRSNRLAKLRAQGPGSTREAMVTRTRGTFNSFAWLAFVDVLVFFAVLLVGFAYLWRRGDLDWVRSTAAQKLSPGEVVEAELIEEAELR